MSGGAAARGAVGGRTRRQQWIWWALMGVLAAVLIASAAGSPPTTGDSNERLYAIAAQLKCQQCVAESVAGSQSASAVQFREEIRAQMRAGRSDDEILNYFADPSRYGPEVLLTPPASGFGALVWILPVVLGAGALLLLASTFLRWRDERPARHATDADADRVAAALRSRASDDRSA